VTGTRSGFALRAVLWLTTMPCMSDAIFPRSPREMMAGWVHLPRFIDKIRLKRAGKLGADYQENFTKGFDGLWLKAAGVNADEFIRIVEGSLTDGEVCDWVARDVRKTTAEKETFNTFVVNRGSDEPGAKARLEKRKGELGLAHRADVLTFVDMIDADEKRI
jgi:hypothetical protein